MTAEKEAKMDIADIASPEIIDAVSLCEDIDLALFREPKQAAFYAEIAEQELKEGKSENEVLVSVGEEIKGIFNQFIQVQMEYSDEEYEKDVYKDAYLDFHVEDGELRITLECCDREYGIKNGFAVTDIMNEAIDKAREVYEAEHKEERKM